MTTTIIKEKGKLTQAIKRASAALDKLDETWHSLCLSSLYHYKEHGDLQYMTAIAKGTARYSVRKDDEAHTKPVWDGRSIRGASIRKWFEDFGGVKWSVNANKNEGGYRASKSVKAVKRNEIDLDKAEASPFYSWTKDEVPDPKVWMADEQATKLRDQARTMLEEGTSKSGRLILPEEAQEARAVASALISSLDEFLKLYGKHASPDAAASIESEVSKGEAVKDEVVESDNLQRINAA